MRHHIRPSLSRLNQRVAAVRPNKRLAAGAVAALLVTGTATGTAVAFAGGSSDTAHTTAQAASSQAAARPSSDAANRSEQRTALQTSAAASKAAAAKAKAQAEAAAKAKAAAQAAAKTKAAAAAAAKAKAQAEAAAQAKAKAQAEAAAQAKAQAAAAAAAAAAKAAATPTYADNLDGWIAEARDILAADGDHVPSADAISARAMTESSGNPDAVNDWDSNAAAGTPSKGLMQMIQPTFNSYALSGHTDIMNPVDNIVAAVRYANATYGAFENIAYGSSGY
ncbi:MULTISPECIES: transglycosylase SLT domain-containing protein [Streptacidiphilus]|uniref:Transglycosylase SLT domain-containing protein n=1 Tax=Streptacidiphilus cavernicola TaxID=3342716 RepID=A0ABV6UL28_9ACTN|nr:transglycosylase SLT domain-containing protein [Streptacidiphilus jeojiense]